MDKKKVIFKITPMPAVKMTVRSHFSRRAQKYFAYQKEIRTLADEMGYTITLPLSLRFHIPMAKSWSKKKKSEFLGKPHTQTPDLDNLIKPFQDSLCHEDSHVWQYGLMEKVWGETGMIEVL
jgi:Holliday junction resolvase RusA-like endonuclease